MGTEKFKIGTPEGGIFEVIGQAVIPPWVISPESAEPKCDFCGHSIKEDFVVVLRVKDCNGRYFVKCIHHTCIKDYKREY